MNQYFFLILDNIFQEKDLTKKKIEQDKTTKKIIIKDMDKLFFAKKKNFIKINIKRTKNPKKVVFENIKSKYLTRYINISNNF